MTHAQKESSDASLCYGHPPARPDTKCGHSLYIRLEPKRSREGGIDESGEDPWEETLDEPYEFIFYYRTLEEIGGTPGRINRAFTRGLLSARSSPSTTNVSDTESLSSGTDANPDDLSSQNQELPVVQPDIEPEDVRSGDSEVEGSQRNEVRSSPDGEHPNKRARTRTQRNVPGGPSPVGPSLTAVNPRRRSVTRDIETPDQRYQPQGPSIDNPQGHTSSRSNRNRGNDFVVIELDDEPSIVDQGIDDNSGNQECNRIQGKTNPVVEGDLEDMDEEDVQLMLRGIELEKREVALKSRLKRLRKKN
ncbi:hypothetical protein IWX90DRAFT_487946 [Phyllosticta citrichinensis]|uniref:Uncharacterized protein n=1 Tax=Phyllosticta citrichinensis TaxID=1130410 RepID=A0ABR1XMJ5_9PEZI